MSAGGGKAHRKKTPVALQLWSVREDAKRDFAATAAAVAGIGYAGVELAGYGNLDAKGAKAALDAAVKTGKNPALRKAAERVRSKMMAKSRR